jgi:hypothetical protein
MALMATATFAQSPPATTFRAHALGEDYSTWVKVENIDLDCTHPARASRDTCKNLAKIQNGDDTDFYTRNDTTTQGFKFHGGHLVQITVENWMIGSNFTEQLEFLEQRYGAPTHAGSQTFQNAFGAHWECGAATWYMPDGGAIFAVESIENLPTVGPTRKLTITVASKERVLQAAKNTPKNPY